VILITINKLDKPDKFLIISRIFLLKNILDDTMIKGVMEMAKRFEVYKCELCGNVVEVAVTGGGQLVCCGKPMTLQKENTVDASKEKHIPVIEKVEGGVIVKVGSVAHPMEEKHFIEWIELLTATRVYRKYLKPGDKPEAKFGLCCDSEYSARAYCNLHGLWKAAPVA